MRNLPPVTRYLLVANLVIFLLAGLLQRYGLDLNEWGGLHYIAASTFHWWQPITYMFLHANLSHIFFNMFAVWMFAPVIEREWGAGRFLIYYLVCGLGAAIVQEARVSPITPRCSTPSAPRVRSSVSFSPSDGSIRMYRCTSSSFLSLYARARSLLYMRSSNSLPVSVP